MAKQFSSDEFGSKHFNIGNFATGDEVLSCDDLYYANRADIEVIFGRLNVKNWADIESEGNLDDIAVRICWALKLAYNTIHNRLTGGPYALPFADPWPQEIRDANARLAGVHLYDSRGLVDADPMKSQIEPHRTFVETFFKDLLSNRKNLFGVEQIAAHVPGLQIDAEPPPPYDLIKPLGWPVTW